MTRKSLLIRIGIGLLLLLAGAAAWAALNAPALKAKLAARQLRNASSDDERARAADRLTMLGEQGLARLVEFVRAGDEPSRAAAIGAIERRLESGADHEPWANATAERLLTVSVRADPAGLRAILDLIPTLLKRTGQVDAGKCRAVVAAGLKATEPSVRTSAVRLAIHDRVKMRTAVVPLLNDPAAEVRSAALVVVAAADGGEPLVTDEDLFRWLHDPDDGVRKVCHDVLASRDRTETEISLGRRLTNPNPRERLRFLLDLRYGDELADPVPWLERLSRDVEPAVRAGAARVAMAVSGDRRLSSPSWVNRVAEADPDPTVRRVAHYFVGEPLRQFGSGTGDSWRAALTGSRPVSRLFPHGRPEFWGRRPVLTICT